LFDLPIGTVTHPQCVLRGDTACVYYVQWEESAPQRQPLFAGALGGAFGAAIAWLGAGSPFMATAVIGGFVVGGWALGRSRALSQDLRRRVKDIDEHNRALDRVTRVNEERFEEVLQAKAEVELKVEERTRELRDATQKLSETLDEIQAVDRAKTDFFNNVSHELRSPLTLILAPLSDLVSGRVPAGGNAAAFETMHRNASRLLRLINQLLDLAKIDAGQMRIALTTVDIAAMLRSALTGFEAAATKKGVALSVHGADELAPIALDPAWIESAIANLVANALRLTPAGGSVRVSVEDRGGEVAISVADDGPGIAQKDLTRIFERFAQGDTATRVIGGTGIGLALVREAVRLHGGDVGVVSELGKGAVFTLTIPRRAAQPLERPQQGAASNSSRVPLLDELGEHAEALERSGPGPTAPLALVVEDNPELRVFIANVLAVRYRVRAVADGAQALASLAHVGPDVVVSDVAMPGMDGYALCRRLRADPRTSAVPVLLVTARTEEGSVLEGFEAGANDYVLKPFHGRELLARVDAHVRLRRMAQELVLRERHAMLGVLAASVAHQVRNPLTTLVSGLPAMRRAWTAR
jgi:signal transduction histidine kinase